MSLFSFLTKNYGDDALKWAAKNIFRRGGSKAEQEALQYFTKIGGRKGLQRALVNDKIIKGSILQRMPRSAKVGLGVVGGAAGLAGVSRLGGTATPAIPEGFTLGDTSTWAGGTGRTAADIAAEYEAQRQILNDMYSQMKPNFPGQEIYDPMTALTTQLAGQSSGAMSDLANQYANTAAGIKQTGVEGAASINDIYGKGAAQMADTASQAGGQYGGMIPVSGAEALAPGEQKALGANLADYLNQNQLINAQTQGGMAELAQLLGPAYANQYALMDAQMRAQAEASKAQRMADYTNAMQEQRANAMMELALQEMRDKQAQKLQEQQLSQAVSMTASPAAIKAYMAEWDKLDDSEKAYYANNFGINTPEDFIRYQLKVAAQYGQGG